MKRILRSTLFALAMLWCASGSSSNAHHEALSAAPASSINRQLTESPRELKDSGWRRTRDGWEHHSSWSRGQVRWQPPAAATFHPSLVGLLQLTASLACLFSFQNLGSSDKR